MKINNDTPNFKRCELQEERLGTHNNSLVDHVIDMIQEINRIIRKMESEGLTNTSFVIVYKEDLELLNSTDWNAFQFTQDTVKWIYENFSYASAVKLMDYAEKNSLDQNIDYLQLARELDSEPCYEW